MKHLLNGVAIAAVLAIATPVWAQTPMAPAAKAPAAAAPAAPKAGAAMAPMGGMKMDKPMMQRHKRGAKAHRGMRHMMGAGDAATEQLNRQELARIQGGGGGMPMAPAPGGGAGQGGPRPSGH